MAYHSSIHSVNWHLISACNYSCRFCFAKNLREKPVPYSEGVKILKCLAKSGMEKINFAGGEPLLHKRLFDYCREAHDLGMVVSITTNGSLLNKKIIHEHRDYIDWIGLSVDSASEGTESKLGRGKGNHVTHSIDVSDAIHDSEIHLKINTTITTLNWMEDMGDFIRRTEPDRWKVFQMLHIKGENDDAVPDLLVTDKEFQAFRNCHSILILKNGQKPVFESADMMESSYFMLTPNGQVKIDTGRKITKYPLDSVLSIGIENIVDITKYTYRGGIYNWN